jgi:hypothetical protein
MTQLISQLGLSYPQNIISKIVAHNNRGSSVSSSPNAVNPIIQDVPRTMSPVIQDPDTSNT